MATRGARAAPTSTTTRSLSLSLSLYVAIKVKKEVCQYAVAAQGDKPSRL